MISEETRKLMLFREKKAVNSVLSTVDGRRFVNTLLRQNGYMQAAFNPEVTALAYNVGKLDTCNALLALCDKHAPELVRLMFDEARKEQDEYRADDTINSERSRAAAIATSATYTGNADSTGY